MRKIKEAARIKFEEHQKIGEELSQYSRNIVDEFEKVFPPETHYDPPGSSAGGKWGKHNYYHLNIIPKEGRAHVTSVTLLYENTFNHFWLRWNRFKNLKVFL
jgi:hypothetical protein